MRPCPCGSIFGFEEVVEEEIDKVTSCGFGGTRRVGGEGPGGCGASSMSMASSSSSFALFADEVIGVEDIVREIEEKTGTGVSS